MTLPTTDLLARARAAAVRARLTADGHLELHGPPSAWALGRELRAREAKVAAVLRREALDELHRLASWRPGRRRNQADTSAEQAGCGRTGGAR